MRVTLWISIGLAAFFGIISLIYGLLADWEAVGVAGLLLCGGLFGLMGGYLALISRRTTVGPADDPHGEIEDDAGDQGIYAPWSWWPLGIAASAAIAFLGLAAGWWIFFIGLGSAVFTLVGFVFEFNRGQHAH